jgi:hypothetical protein
MNRPYVKLTILALSGALAFATSALAQGSVGGPTKQTGVIGGPNNHPSPLVPGQKTGTVTVSPTTGANNSTVKKGKK